MPDNAAQLGSIERRKKTMAGKISNVQAAYYVATDGDDKNSGMESEPFKTVEKARDVVRNINKNMTGDILVFLRGGVYPVEQTIAFDARDSGSNGHNVIYSSYPGEKVVVSGGKRILGWRRDSKGRWKARVDIDNFRQLYVNGHRARRTRRRAPSGLKLWNIHGYRTRDSRMAKWRNQSDIEFCYDSSSSFCHTRCKLGGIAKSKMKGCYDVWMWKPYFFLARTKDGMRIELPSYVENVFEFLTKPGEWYLDRSSDTVYYIPRRGEDMETAEVIAPVVERLIELKGSFEEPVHNIRFAGIAFAHATWLEPSENGFIDVQANFRVTPGLNFIVRDSLALLHGECIKSPATVVCRAAKSIHFERCVFTQLGGGGLDLECGSQDNVISGCDFYDISGTAVQVGDVLREHHHPDDPRAVVKNNAVTNNHIHEVAVEYKGGLGIFVGYTDGTVISHNEISRLPYSGVSVGWGWGETDAGGGARDQPSRFDTPTVAKNNRIEHNHIHHVMLELCDGGGIYTLGNMPGTIIRENYIHDNRGFFGGIYLDEGSGHIEVTRNVVWNVVKPMNYNNLAQNRKDTCKEHGNYFAQKRKDVKCPEKILRNAGLEPGYQDLLGPHRGSGKFIIKEAQDGRPWRHSLKRRF